MYIRGIYHREIRTDIMRTEAQKWGNSLAVRIPKQVAEAVHLMAGTPVDIEPNDHGIVISILEQKPEYDLEALLSGVTDENLHAETDTGEAVGRELF